MTVLLLGAYMAACCAAPGVAQAAQQDPAIPSRTSETMASFASAEQTAEYVRSQGSPPLLVFTEDRSRPVRRDDRLPLVWLDRSASERGAFHGRARPGEYYAFQVAIYNAAAAAHNLVAARLDMPGIPAERIHCLNFEARPAGEPPLRDGLPIAPHSLQVLWFLVEAPGTAGDVQGAADIQCRDIVSGGFTTLRVPVTLHVDGAPIPAGGVDESSRLARLAWLLPSDLGTAHSPTAGYDPVRLDGYNIGLTGKTVNLAATGLPAQLSSVMNGSDTGRASHTRSLLQAPVRLVVETEEGSRPFEAVGKPVFSEQTPDGCSWCARGTAGPLLLSCRGRLEFDGSLRYELTVSSERTVRLRDIRLEIPYRADAARYGMGLGLRGGLLPSAPLRWKWDVARHQDSLWLGDVSIGAQWQLKGPDYRRPLVNIYYPFRPLVLPESWCNNGRGGVTVERRNGDCVLVTAYSGARTIEAEKPVEFDIEVSLTPARPIDTDRHWAVRYYHPGGSVDRGHGDEYLANIRAIGANVLNIHHRQPLNPFINYPFSDAAAPELTDFVRRAHAAHIRVKVYYTTREVTQNMPEFFALYQLDGAVMQPGPGSQTRTILHPNGPNAWLTENLGSNFIPAWYTELDGRYAGMKDISVLTTPDGPWNNFYLHGLDWLVRHTGVDGVYIDDTALDRATLQRARRILERDAPAPLIDLHSWNPYSDLDSHIVSASLYMDLLPYVDRLWLGEGADYNQTPDAWLVQYSGIPFGVMSEMLEGGGNPWRGMPFGMTSRAGASGDPSKLWKYWDEFGMAGSVMFGWWDGACPVRTGNSHVPATVYRKPGRALVALASWSAHEEEVKLEVDWKALGIDPAHAAIHADAIDGFQPSAVFAPDEAIHVPPGRGWLLVLEARPAHRAARNRTSGTAYHEE